MAKQSASVSIQSASRPATHILKYCVDIDASKADLEVCFRSIDSEQHSVIKGSRSFTNGSKGFTALTTWVEKLRKQSDVPLIFVMEATGVYHEAVAYFLTKKSYSVSIVLPNKAKKYMGALGLKSKNDRIDASGLAQMGCEQKLDIWQMPNESTRQLRDLTRHLEFLHQQMTQCGNRLEAHEHKAMPNDVVTKHLKNLQKALKKQIAEVNKQIKAHVKQHTDLQEKVNCVTSIEGVGLLTAAVIISEMNDFQLIENQRQLVSFCGYDAVENQSGKRKRKTKISKMGNAHVRRILYMPSMTVVRLGVPHFVNLFQRVYKETKIKMVAYVAVQKKLLTTIYALYKKGEMFDPNYNNQETTAIAA